MTDHPMPAQAEGDALQQLRKLHAEYGARYDSICAQSPNDFNGQQIASAKQKAIGKAIAIVQDAPQKPAPDAVREALAPFLQVAAAMKFYVPESMPDMTFPRPEFESRHADEPRCATLTIADFERLAALAAPVPPADGKCPDCGKSLRDDDEPHQLDCENRTTSPAGAAEPDPLADLVSRFSKALLTKLRLAQANGRSGWELDDWEADCQQGLLRHVAKGDPRDVAAYCAFLWHHGWITALPTVRVERETMARCIFKRRMRAGDEAVDSYFTRYSADSSGIDRMTMAIYNAFQDADAILALPAQYGAGERWRADVENAPKEDVLFMLRQNRTACVACHEVRGDGGVWLDETEAQIFPIAWMQIPPLSKTGDGL